MQSVFELIYQNGMDPAEYWYSTGGSATASSVEAFVNSYNNWLRRRGESAVERPEENAGAALSGLPLSTLMTQAGNMMASGNSLGAAEYLIMAASQGALTEEQLERILNQMGLGGQIDYGE